MKENVIKEEVTLLGVSAMDFKTNDGSKICGYKYYCSRELKDSEKDGNFFGRKVEEIFIARDNIDDKDKYKMKTFPCKATIEFEFISLNKKPKAISVVI